jgi:hypothetical protein
LSNHHHRDHQNADHHQKVIETRYQTSRYFLQNQLRTSDAVQDFKTVKNLMDATAYFNVRRTFKFAMETVPVQSQNHKK